MLEDRRAGRLGGSGIVSVGTRRYVEGLAAFETFDGSRCLPLCVMGVFLSFNDI